MSTLRNTELRLPSTYRRGDPGAPGYRLSMSTPDDPGPSMPEVFTSELARRFGADRVVRIEATDGASSDAAVRVGSAPWDHGDVAGSVLLCTGALEVVSDPLVLLTHLRDLRPSVLAIVVVTPDRDRCHGPGHMGPPPTRDHITEWTPDELHSLLASNGLEPLIHGTTRMAAGSSERTSQIAMVAGGLSGLDRRRTRPSALAFVPCYNELDIIAVTVERLLRQGIEVQVVDNWSNDGSWELMRRQFGDDPRVRMERFPEQSLDRFDWASMLEHIDARAAATHHEWILHVDADEQFDAFAPNLDVLDVLGLAQGAGYDVIDSTLLEFRPYDDSSASPRHASGRLPDRWEFATRSGARTLERAWLNRGSRVGLADHGGHALSVPKRVFPLNLVLRHYPLRSPEQARRKIFQDRLPRYARERVERGWHIHYDHFDQSSGFLWPAEDLYPWEWDTTRAFVVEMATRVGVEFTHG